MTTMVKQRVDPAVLSDTLQAKTVYADEEQEAACRVRCWCSKSSESGHL